SWDEHNEKVLGNITLRVSPSIQVAISHLTMVKEVWEHLRENYGTPSIRNAYAKLSHLLSTTIPASSHPAPMITKMLSHFTYLKDTGFEFPANMQAMVILCKLPPTMEVVAQILSQTSPSEIKTLKPDGIVKAATLSFEQKGAFHGGVKESSTVRTGNFNSSSSSRAGPTVDGPVPTVDPHALAHTQPGATNYSPPAFDNTIKAFDLAHCLGVEPSCQTICTLDSVISTTSAKLDQPEAGPSSLKCPHLEECISMDNEEDTISLGDKEQPFVYEDFTDSEFDKVDAMVLDQYNAVSMNLALYIASNYYNMSCRVSSQAYNICSHEIHDMRCANCKGKMADGSEMSSAFWLLDSGASCHFTGDLRDFASYQELKHKHYAKMANGVAEIAGIGMVLLQCLDHNTGDEKVVKLTQVLHMPSATACLISMGKMLLCNYRVAGDRKGISL
ncbi:hypothetical protein SCLCIDRAFT_49633, partial [Scleroderma citrinum Foug A]